MINNGMLSVALNPSSWLALDWKQKNSHEHINAPVAW
jgi:hypothetical protein